MELTDIYTTFHSKEEEYTVFSRAHVTCASIDHRLSHKTSLNKLRKNGIKSSNSIDTKKNGVRNQLQENASPQPNP